MTTERTDGEPTQRVSPEIPQPEELERQRTEMDDRDIDGGQFEPPKEGYTPGAPPQPTETRDALAARGGPWQTVMQMVTGNKMAAASIGALALLALVGLMRSRPQSKQDQLIHQAEEIVRRLEQQFEEQLDKVDASKLRR